MLPRLSRVVPTALIGCAMALSCSFPDLTYRSDQAPVPDAASSDALPPDVDPEGKNRDAATRGDAGGRIDAGPDAAAGCLAVGFDPCDCDSDHAKNGSPNCAPAPGARADCDDFDALISPGQEFVAEEWDPASPHRPEHDWNCDGTVTKQFPYGVTCALLGNACSEGFATDVPCGQEGPYNICKVGLNILGIMTCSVDRTETRTQGCR